MSRKFLRVSTKFYKRIGRKKNQKWRKPRGRHNKIREKRKGRARKVEVGFRKAKSERGKIQGKMPLLVGNLKDAEKIEKGDLVIIKKIGGKKRKELEEKIKEKGGKILN